MLFLRDRRNSDQRAPVARRLSQLLDSCRQLRTLKGDMNVWSLIGQAYAGCRLSSASAFSERYRRMTNVAVCAFAVSVAPFISGCSARPKKDVSQLSWCDDKDDRQLSSYKGHATDVSHVCLDNETSPIVQRTLEPRNLLRRNEEQIYEISLHQVIQMALANNEIVQTSAVGGVGSSPVLNSPRGVSSIYDPAIQESGVLFGGGLGVEAALSRFDTQFMTSALWGRSTATLTPRETATFTSGLSKQFATGGTVQLSNNWNYLGTPTGAPFTSAYTGSVGLAVRQPLLAGSGVEFTRIAGPTNPAFGSITGVGQGVVISRINNDITVAGFEQAVRGSVRDIENAYWDLYLAYRTFDTAVVAHRSARRSWREARDKNDIGLLDPAEELQAQDRLYETKAQVEQVLNALYRAEANLRRLVGLPVNDGRVLRPADEPSVSEYIPDWEMSLRQGLSQRTELRAQKMRIKSLQLQLKAAQSLVRPTMNAVGSYDINGFGDRLLGTNSINPATGLPIGTASGSLVDAGLETWTAGVEVTVPIGYRSQRSQVRNLELQLRKDTAVLAAQEKDVAHEIAIAIQDVTSAFSVAQSNHKRMLAAKDRVEKLNIKKDFGTLTLDLVLRAQASVAQAESSYYQQVVNYNKALVDLNLATGSLLEYNGIFLGEGHWTAEAYSDAQIHAAERTHAKPNPHVHTEPPEFVSPGPTGTIERRVVVPHSSNIPPVPEPGEIPPPASPDDTP